MGSIFAARMAGSQLAIAATVSNDSVTPPRVIGS
jgi:hypothetical protein